MMRVRFNYEEKVYLGQMGHVGGGFRGATYFTGQEDLQVVARLAKRGIVRLEHDDECYDVVVQPKYRKEVERRFYEFLDIWLKWYRKKKK